jgi:uncharacterized protein (TIGR03066 family)
MNRKTFTLGLVSAATAIALNACSAKKPHIGKWKVEGDKETMIFEFQENGTLQLTMNGNPFLSAKYEFTDNKMTINTGDGVTSTSVVKVEGDQMTMTQTGGATQVLKRVKN